MRQVTPIRPTRRAGATPASTTPASSRVTAERGKSADERLAAHAEDGVAADQDVEVDGVEAVGRGVREGTHIARRDRLPHPSDEFLPLGGRVDMPQPPQAGTR